MVYFIYGWELGYVFLWKLSFVWESFEGDYWCIWLDEWYLFCKYIGEGLGWNGKYWKKFGENENKVIL